MIMTNKTPTDVLRELWGYDSFRPGQLDAIMAQLIGKDCLFITPTGGGKSITFQIPATLRPGITVVVSPLIALMKDQVEGAARHQVAAATINSSTEKDDLWKISRDIYTGKIKLLYVSPERLVTESFRKFMQFIEVSGIVVDEAHCIAQDGPEFRPEYLRISDAIAGLNVPLYACTATATPETQQEIIQMLGMSSPVIIKNSFNRPNLFYEVFEKRINEIDQIIENIKHGDGIIYRTTRAHVEYTARKLNKVGIRCLPYHAGMSIKQRTEAQEKFLSGEIPIIVATVAFGLGIDKPNIRWVIHADMPKNIEGYYQETGRAGRDSKDAHCTLLFSERDIPQVRRLIDKTLNNEHRERGQDQLSDMILFASTDGCRRQFLLNYFGENAPENCLQCDNCLNRFKEVEPKREVKLLHPNDPDNE